ncbi:MAG: hypothetical protein P4L43_13425 [Syntrophobacteraceae bacterium]|nr:hypothetical protein [Syntrophobacteraceae bacterium]
MYPASALPGLGALTVTVVTGTFFVSGGAVFASGLSDACPVSLVWALVAVGCTALFDCAPALAPRLALFDLALYFALRLAFFEWALVLALRFAFLVRAFFFAVRFAFFFDRVFELACPLAVAPAGEATVSAGPA